MNRRELIQRVILGSTTLILIPTFLTSCEKEQTPVTGEISGPKPDSPKSNLVIDMNQPDYSALNTAGGSKVVDGIIIANTGTNGFVALSSACTHQGTQLKYNSKSNSFECFSHGSVFSSTGSVTTGPASVPLQTYTVTRSGNILTVVR